MKHLMIIIATISLAAACGDSGGAPATVLDSDENSKSQNNSSSNNSTGNPDGSDTPAGRLFEHSDADLHPDFLAQLERPEAGTLPCREREYLFTSDPDAVQTEEPREVYELTWQNGNLVSKVGAEFSYYYQYDGQGRLVERREARPSEGSQPEVDTYSFRYDDQGRPLAEVGPTYTIEYEYDGAMRLAKLTLDDEVKEFEEELEYDEEGRIIKVKTDTGTTSNVYVAERLVLTKSEDGMGTSVADAIEYYNGIEVGRQETFQPADAEPSYTFYVREFASCSSDGENNTQTDGTPSWFTGKYPGPCSIETYTGLNGDEDVQDLLANRLPNQLRTFSYRLSDGQKSREAWDPDNDGTPSWIHEYAYHPDGRLASITSVQRYEQAYRYDDPDNRPDGWRRESLEGALLAEADIFYETLPNGWKVKEYATYSDGDTRLTEKEYDSSGEIQSEVLSSGGNVIWRHSYIYDDQGFLERKFFSDGDQSFILTTSYANDPYGNVIFSWLQTDTADIYRYNCFDFGDPWW